MRIPFEKITGCGLVPHPVILLDGFDIYAAAVRLDRQQVAASVDTANDLAFIRTGTFSQCDRDRNVRADCAKICIEVYIQF